MSSCNGKRTDTTRLAIPVQIEEENDTEKREEKIRFLRNCIAGLPEVDRIFITLFMEDVPQEKIAKISV